MARLVSGRCVADGCAAQAATLECSVPATALSVLVGGGGLLVLRVLWRVTAQYCCTWRSTPLPCVYMRGRFRHHGVRGGPQGLKGVG